jgi:hypothetical protein
MRARFDLRVLERHRARLEPRALQEPEPVGTGKQTIDGGERSGHHEASASYIFGIR